MDTKITLEMEKNHLTRVWTSLSEHAIAKIESRMIAEQRTFSGMVRRLILLALYDQPQ